MRSSELENDARPASKEEAKIRGRKLIMLGAVIEGLGFAYFAVMYAQTGGDFSSRLMMAAYPVIAVGVALTLRGTFMTANANKSG